MESLRELLETDAGTFAMAARYRSLNGEILPPGLGVDSAAQTGVAARCAATGWLRAIVNATGQPDVLPALRWLLDHGYRRAIASDIERVRKARAAGQTDARVPWASREVLTVIESHEDELLHPGLLAYDVALALELLLCAFTTDAVDHDGFWMHIEEVHGRLLEQCNGWNDYARGVALGKAIYGSRIDTAATPGVIPREAHAKRRRRVPWPESPPPVAPPLASRGTPLTPDGDFPRRAAGLVLQEAVQPGPVLRKELRRYGLLQAGRLALEAGGLVTASLVLTAIAGTAVVPTLLIVTVLAVLLIRPLRLRSLPTMLALWNDLRHHEALRLASGRTVAIGQPNAAHVALESAGVLLTGDDTCHAMLLAPTRDIAFWVDDEFLPTPVPLLVLSSVTPRNAPPEPLPEPHEPPKDSGTPGRRRLTGPERAQLRQLVAAARSELRHAWIFTGILVLAAPVLHVAALRIGTVGDGPILVRLAAIIVVLVLAGLAIDKAVRLISHTRIVRLLQRDLAASEVLVVRSGDYGVQHPGMAAPPFVYECLPHTHRLWTQGNAEADWRW